MLPREFLSQIADKYELSPEQTDVFLEKFSSKKSDEAIAAGLHISLQAVSYRLGEVYKKFSFNGKGTGKAFQLLSFLTEEFVKTSASGSPRSDGSEDDLDELVQKVRSLYRDRNQRLYGTMRLWRVNDPVPVDRIYVDVNILDRPSRDFCSNIDGLWQDFNSTPKSLDRLGLGKVRQRIGGIKAVEDYFRRKTNVIVQGRPGSGKTTFLQHIFIKCNEGKLPFLANLVPVFIRLRDFINDVKDNSVGAYSHTPLLGCIRQQLRRCSEDEIERLFEQGRMLILLDGLDEVPGEDSKAIVRQVEKLVRDYDQNRLILSCRTQAQEYRFNNFAEVEVADFDKEQVKEFAQRWFIASAQNPEQEAHCEEKAQLFIEQFKLPENHQIRDLAVTPILLSLTCWVFRDQNRFYSKPAELYEKGLKLLLKEWDESKLISRDEVYRKLSVPQKEELLSYVAAVKFEQRQYVLFDQDEIQGYIADYLRNLPNTQDAMNHVSTREKSEAVLKSIEAQHGLLVERASRIYSFSHLTFQEYFTVKWFVEGADWQNLVRHITEKHWREVFSLTLVMLQSADHLLQFMKQEVDAIVAGDKKLQQFLMWLKQKSLSVKVPYKQVVVRDFYLNLTNDFNDALSNLELVHPSLSVFFRSPFGLFEPVVDASPPISFNVPDFDIDKALVSALEQALELSCVLNPPLRRAFALPRTLNRAITETPDSNLKTVLTQLKHQLPDPDKDIAKFRLFWKGNGGASQFCKIIPNSNQIPMVSGLFKIANVQNWDAPGNGQTWVAKLRTVMIQHRNIGHDWQFSNQQNKLLKQYSGANKFLAKCLNSGCNVTPAVREKIEDTLLLPIAEIEKRRQQS